MSYMPDMTPTSLVADVVKLSQSSEIVLQRISTDEELREYKTTTAIENHEYF